MDYGYTVDKVTEEHGLMVLHLNDGTQWQIERSTFDETTGPTGKTLEQLAEGHLYYKRHLYTQI